MDSSLGMSFANSFLLGDNLLGGLEKVLSTCLWLIPHRFTSHEVPAEVCQSVLGVTRVLYDGVIRFKEVGIDSSFTWSMAIKFIRQVEVLYEIRASHLAALGEGNMYSSMAGLEFLKLFARLFLFRSSNYALTTLLSANTTAESHMECSRNSDCVLGAFKSLSDSRLSLISSSWEAKQGPCKDDVAQSHSPCTLAAEDGIQEDNGAAAAEFLPWWDKARSPEVTEEEEQDPPCKDNSRLRYKLGQTMLLIGEMLYLIRPVICVCALRRFGTGSWKPWLISLGMDACSRFLLSKGESIMKYAGVNQCNKLTIQDQLLSYLTMVRNFQWSPVEKKEMKRRKTLFLIYLLRSPVFELVTKYGLDSTQKITSSIPVLGQTMSKALELLYGVQRYYVYTSGSW